MITQSDSLNHKELNFVKTQKVEESKEPKSNIRLASEKDIEEYKQVKLNDSERRVEIPRASELELTKDPRLLEFEGSEKFEESITHLQEFSKNVVSTRDVDELTDLIARTNKHLTLKYKREHKYNITPSQEHLYKEVTFETSDLEIIKSTEKTKNPLKNQGAVKVRNWDALNADGMKKAELPKHPMFKLKTQNKFEEYMDVFKYLENPTENQSRAFNAQEDTYRNLMTLKHTFLQETFSREIENRSLIPEIVPIVVGSHMYYRNLLNAEDNFTIYRYPVAKVSEGERGRMPTKDLDKYEQRVFKLSDLTPYYDHFALRNEAIKDFVEKISELAAVQTYDPIHYFNINKTENYAAIIFDTQRDGKNFDIIVKDVLLDRLMPMIILNSTGSVAFDQLNGFYYVLRDLNGRGKT